MSVALALLTGARKPAARGPRPLVVQGAAPVAGGATGVVGALALLILEEIGG